MLRCENHAKGIRVVQRQAESVPYARQLNQPEWCAERRIALAEGEARVAPDPTLSHAARTLYANGSRCGREPAFAATAVRALGDSDECLPWVTLVGVWPSGEDCPAYYALRGGAEGERRQVEKALGHLFEAGEQGKLERLLTAAMENWDTFALPAGDGQTADVRLHLSHDEWVELQARAPVEFASTAS